MGPKALSYGLFTLIFQLGPKAKSENLMPPLRQKGAA